MTPDLRAQVRAILPLLSAQNGRLSFHNATPDDLDWAERELGGRRSVYAAVEERWPDGTWSYVSVEEAVSVDLRLDLVAKPVIVSRDDPSLARVTAAFEHGGSTRPAWVRGDGTPPWGAPFT